MVAEVAVVLVLPQVVGDLALQLVGIGADPAEFAEGCAALDAALGVGRDLGVGVGRGVAVGVALAVAVGVAVGVGVAPPEGAWIATIIGEPVLK